MDAYETRDNKRPTSPMRNLILPALLIASLASCQSAYYAAMEKAGVHKREILVDRMAAAREDQVEAKEQIQTTYEAFQELTGFDGVGLEAIYEKLKSEYEDAKDEASDVSSRIDSVESVAGAMFDEWEDEINEITNADLRSKSLGLRKTAMKRYDNVLNAMHAAESKMAPVLESFNNHVLFLKHNLNAEAISSLKGTSMDIESDVAELIQSMQLSIDEADTFLQQMKPGV